MEFLGKIFLPENKDEAPGELSGAILKCDDERMCSREKHQSTALRYEADVLRQ